MKKSYKMTSLDWDVAQLVQNIRTMHKALDSVPSTTNKPGVAVPANNPGTQRVEAGGSEVQCYLRLFLKTNAVKRKKPHFRESLIPLPT